MIGGQATTPLGGGTLTSNAPRPKADPREVKSLMSRQRSANEISAFLAKIGESVEPKTLLAPTAKDFGKILKALVGQLDRTYPLGTNAQKKFEDEVVPALKVMLYPFAESITKSHLQSIGSQQSWPNMLAMLHWLVMIIEVRFPYLTLNSNE